MPMTNEQFDQFVLRRFGGSTNGAATELELHRDTVQAMRTGKTRKGSDYPIPRHIELAAKALDTVEPPSDPLITEAGDPKGEIEIFNGSTWIPLSDSWFGPDRETIARWSKLVRDWPSAAKIIGGAVMGYPTRIKGRPSSAELIVRDGGDAFAARLDRAASKA